MGTYRPTFIELIIFDVDGTLADRDTSELLPGVAEWFRENGRYYQIAFATNQGGVGLRYWMEEGGFGNPKDYPDITKVYNHLESVYRALPDIDAEKALFDQTHVCFAYQSKKSGEWGPVPEQSEKWDSFYRKPSPGMLLRAMKHADVSPGLTLMIGDSEEDQLAAKAAGCLFERADTFFGR